MNSTHYQSQLIPKNHRRIDPAHADENHETIWQLFPGHPRNDRPFIFRPTGNAFYIISSEMPIDTQNKFILQTKSFNIPTVELNAQVGFISLINAIIRIGKKDHDVVSNYRCQFKAKNIPLSDWPSSTEIYYNAILSWFESLNARHGFKVSDLQINGKITMPTKNFHIIAHDVSGMLTVTDPERFLISMYQGIGDKRDRGCGMVMLRGA